MTQDPYVRKSPTHYGVKHEPLMVTAIASNRREGQVVGFIGKQLCFFEHDGYIPTVGETVEVMISRPIFGKYTKEEADAIEEAFGKNSGHRPPVGSLNRSKLIAVLIRPVEPDKHQLMAINGFECSGTMCRTITQAIPTDGSRAIPQEEISRMIKNGDDRLISLTPGRCGIREANNVNAGATWKQPYQDLIPTNVYIDKKILEERSTMFYIIGMTRVEDCQYRNLFKT